MLTLKSREKQKKIRLYLYFISFYFSFLQEKKTDEHFFLNNTGRAKC